MKVLVTGGAGFIASHIVDVLVEDGHEVIVGWSWSAVLFIMSSAVILSLIRLILWRRLIDLL